MSAEPTAEARASFHQMKHGTKEDWQIIGGNHAKLCEGTADRVLAHLRLLDGDYGGFAVDRLTHSLQTATLAIRDGRDDEYVVAALLHDIGDTLAPNNHPEVGAAILRPFVSPRVHWIVQHHGVFQGYYFWHHIGMDRDARDQFAGHEWYDDCAEFCELYDQAAFDPAGETMPLEEFEPIVRRVLHTRTGMVTG
ncbi:MAG: HD domain-containing protein [bacterium]|nr:HD domain-containing protein [bacterium]